MVKFWLWCCLLVVTANMSPYLLPLTRGSFFFFVGCFRTDIGCAAIPPIGLKEVMVVWGGEVGHIFGDVRRCRWIFNATLLSGGLSMWIDGVADVKVDFAVALVVVVAKVNSLKWHRTQLWWRWLLLFQRLLVVGCCVGSWCCWLGVVCEQQNVGSGSCFCGCLWCWLCVFFIFYVCWVKVLVQLLFSFVCCYFTTSNLAFLVLVKIHCDFNKFYFNFFKKKA